MESHVIITHVSPSTMPLDGRVPGGTNLEAVHLAEVARWKIDVPVYSFYHPGHSPFSARYSSSSQKSPIQS